MDSEQSSQVDSSISETNDKIQPASSPLKPVEEDVPESRTKTPEIDEETSSSTGTKTTDDDGSTAITSSSFSTSENTIDKDPDSHSNEYEKALEILKEFTKFGDSTPKKRDYSYGPDVDDAFEGSSASMGNIGSSLGNLIISEKEKELQKAEIDEVENQKEAENDDKLMQNKEKDEMVAEAILDAAQEPDDFGMEKAEIPKETEEVEQMSIEENVEKKIGSPPCQDVEMKDGSTSAETEKESSPKESEKPTDILDVKSEPIETAEVNEELNLELEGKSEQFQPDKNSEQLKQEVKKEVIPKEEPVDEIVDQNKHESFLERDETVTERKEPSVDESEEPKLKENVEEPLEAEIKSEPTTDKVEEDIAMDITEEEPQILETTEKEPQILETTEKETQKAPVDLLPEEEELLKQAEMNETNESAKVKPSSASSSDSEEEYFTGKECINTNCKGDSSKYVKASKTVIKYYYAKEKKQDQYVCRECKSKFVDSFFSMSEMLLKNEALLKASRPKKSDFVQLIDSSDEEQDEKNETTEGESSLDEDTLELIDSNLIPTIKYVFNQIGMGDQIRKNEQVLQGKMDSLNKKLDFLQGDLSNLQNEADNIGKRIYSCTKVNYKHLAPVDCGNLVLTDSTNFVPPMGPIDFTEVMVNSTYYGQIKDPLSPWVKGKVLYKEKNSVYSFNYAANGRYTQRSMAKRHLAYLDPPDKRVDTGARIIALYDTYRLQGKLQGSTCWMVGIVAEPAKSQNKYRYLVFFDNGYAQYVSHSDIRLICGPSPQVWEDVHISNREFIKDYLQQYQFHRPMVRTQVGQKMLTRWDGRFFNSTVKDIDCSLIRMQSDRDPQKIEWLYRGSKRLEPVYKAYQKEQSEKLQRDMQAKSHTQQMRRQELNPTANVNVQSAKKKTYATRQPIQPQPVKHLNNAIIYVDDEPNNKGKIEYLTVKQERQPKSYQPHSCSKRCLLKMNYTQLKSYSPLAKPLICGWDRQIYKGKGRKFVVYKAPCGFSCRNMQSVHTYLRATENPLNVESFDFSWEVNCLAQYEDKSYELRIEDLSNGLEQMPVECVNYYDKTLPPPCEYSTKRIPTDGVNLNLDEEFLVGCDCEGDCSIRKDCACWQLTLKPTKFFNLNAAEVGYHNKRLYDGVSTGIYECNSRCKCSSQCVNRVVQHPLELKLQVFKTNNRGWGIRCLNDIPKGCFICVYAGNLLTEQNANEGGKDTGDEYFAELDYIEVVEKQKEGYESDAESMSQSDSEDEYNPASNDLEWRSASKRQPRRCTTASNIYNREQRERKKNNKFFDDEDSPKKYKSIRKYYGNNEACYVMDAKVTGNLGRYFNHSCDPNLYVQNVFVDTHDLRFPWVAFFSSKFIRAGTELTWNYNYEVGVVPGKVLYCECGAFNCRGRLL